MKYVATGRASEQCNFDTPRSVQVRHEWRNRASNRTRNSMSNMDSFVESLNCALTDINWTAIDGSTAAFAKLTKGGIIDRGRFTHGDRAAHALFHCSANQATVKPPGGCSTTAREPSGNVS